MNAYKADRISDQLWIVKRFKNHKTVPDNFTEADYDECEVVVATDDPFEAIAEAIKKGMWS